MVHDQDLVSIQEVRAKVDKAYAAWLTYRTFPQERIDSIVESAAAAARANAQRLAELAVEETGYGNVRDKIAKNLLNADLLVRAMRGLKTVGVLREIPEQKVVEFGVPAGVIAAVLPTTNPTSTAIFKVLISLKAGNGIVVAPHPRAIRSTCETVEILTRAAVEAGAPEDLIQALYHSTLDGTTELMKHRRTAIILATGGGGMVKAAYSSGKPAFGVGPGNVPVLLDRGYDVAAAVRMVVEGKRFDYGTVCSSEQTLVAEESLRDSVVAELKKNKAHFCNEAERKALEKILLKPNFRINPDCVGQSPQKLARMAGFSVAADAAILVAEIGGVGKEHPLSVEKLSPVLALLFVKDFDAGVEACEAVIRFGGMGHTCVIYSNDDARVRAFAARVSAMRVLVNTPAPAGSTGMTTNIWPSMTLGCGAAAGNVTSDNVGPQHLINIKRLAYAVRTSEEALTIPPMVETAAVAKSAAALDRDAIVAAVESYLAKKGFVVTKTAAAAPAPAAPHVAADRTANVAAQVVDRFLGARKSPSPAPIPVASMEGAPPSCACACSIPQAKQPEAKPAPPPAPKPEVAIVDFVCENDVRAAIRDSVKIYVGAKTIVTPAARDLAAQHDILVVAQR